MYTWIHASPLTLEAAFRVDRLTSVMILIVTGVGFLIHVYSLGYMHDDPRRRALLRLPEPVHRLDADPGAGRLAADAVHRLGGRRPLLLPADRLLVRRRGQRRRRPQGVHRQPHRRRRLPGRHVPALLEPRVSVGYADAGLRRHQPPGAAAGRAVAGGGHRRLPAAVHRRHRQVGADPALRLAARRDGRPDAGLGADPRRHHGHRRRLHDRPPVAALRARRRRRWTSSAIIGAATAFFAATIGLVQTRPQEDPRLLDRLAARLHVPRRSAAAPSRRRSST